MAKISTSMAFESVQGEVGLFSVVQGRGGLVLRRKPVYRRPVSPGQQSAIDRMREVNQIWAGFDAAQAAAWDAYAQSLTRHDSLTGEPYAPTGYNAFCGLATKFLQVNPGGVVPTIPPATPWAPDAVAVTVTPVAQGILFTADRANQPGTVTELLVEPLANIRRKPAGRTRSGGFAAFGAGHLAQAVATDAGVFACSVREVESATGRASLPTPIGIVVVGG